MNIKKTLTSTLSFILVVASILGIGLGWNKLQSLINSKVSKSSNCIGGKNEVINGESC